MLSEVNSSVEVWHVRSYLNEDSPDLFFVEVSVVLGVALDVPEEVSVVDAFHHDTGGDWVRAGGEGRQVPKTVLVDETLVEVDDIGMSH